MNLTRLAAPVAVAATLFAGTAGASASSTPTYVKQIDTICASLPTTPNITGTISAANIKNATTTKVIFVSLLSKLKAVTVPGSASDLKPLKSWVLAVDESANYLTDAIANAKSGKQSAYVADLKKAFNVAAAGKKYSEQAGLNGC